MSHWVSRVQVYIYISIHTLEGPVYETETGLNIFLYYILYCIYTYAYYIYIVPDLLFRGGTG